MKNGNEKQERMDLGGMRKCEVIEAEAWKQEIVKLIKIIIYCFKLFICFQGESSFLFAFVWEQKEGQSEPLIAFYGLILGTKKTK